jgi:hypothetical protein
MVWNIQQFGTNKIQQAEVQGCIMSTIYAPDLAAALPVRPGILVVIEVLARPGTTGIVSAGSGAAGMWTLLGLLQAQEADWLAVPPICTGERGRAEVVGVFYRSTQCTFIGPHVWTTQGPVPFAQIAAQTPPWSTHLFGAVPVAAAYPAPWNGAPFNLPGAPAPQIFYPNAANNGFVNFPDTDFRRPVRTKFQYPPGGAGLIDLWSFHTSPSWIFGMSMATQAMANLATVPDIATPAAAGEVRLVAGDLNIDAMNPGSYAAAFGAFTALNYVPQLGTEVASLINPPTSTMFVESGGRYNAYLRNLSVDNFLTLAHAGTPIAGAWVIDRVAGAPAPPYLSDLGTPLATIALMDNAASQAQSFRSWANLGHIGNRASQVNMVGVHGASDHLPILIEF